MNIKKFTIQDTATIFEVLKQIEKNKKGFVIILNKNDLVKGTMTDGDVRRSILKGKLINDTIDGQFNKDFAFIRENDPFDKIIEIFKSTKIDFVPIIDKNNKLINILTKRQLHILLLEGVSWDLKFDFTLLDKRDMDHEIYNRPWGYYKTVFLSKYTRSKIIQVNSGEALSLQKHKKREEHWVVIKGIGEIVIGESVKSVSEGSYVFIPRDCKHRITNLSNDNPLIISEVQLGSYFGEDDIIRYSDKYGRI